MADHSSNSSSLQTTSMDSDHMLPISSQKASSSSSSHWSSSLAVSLVRPMSREASQGSSKTAEGETGTNLQATAIRPGRSSPSPSQLVSSLPLQAQVARSELNVRLPRGIWGSSICIVSHVLSQVAHKHLHVRLHVSYTHICTSCLMSVDSNLHWGEVKEISTIWLQKS